MVATVSCIYGLGTPQEYVERALKIKLGESRDRDELLRTLVTEQYTRNDLSFTRGTFRVRGDTIEVFPVYEELACPDRDVRRRGRAALLPAPAHR